MILHQPLQWREGSPFYHCRLENVAYNQLLIDDQVPAKMVEKANRLMPKTVSEGGSGLALHTLPRQLPRATEIGRRS
jgi:hypothetical protein